MFLLGLVCGVLAVIGLWLLIGGLSDPPPVIPARQSVHEIERYAIRQMVATAIATDGSSGARKTAATQPTTQP